MTNRVYGHSIKVVVYSAHLPYDSAYSSTSNEVLEIIFYCREKRLSLILGRDANFHHVVW
jgi:hypothetical protein